MDRYQKMNCKGNFFKWFGVKYILIVSGINSLSSLLMQDGGCHVVTFSSKLTSITQKCQSNWLTLPSEAGVIRLPNIVFFVFFSFSKTFSDCVGFFFFLVKAKTKLKEFKVRLLEGPIINMEIQLHLIIFCENHMMTVVQRHKSEGLVWLEGKGSNSLSTNPGLHPHRAEQSSNMETLTYHICMQTLQSPLLSFDTENTTACMYNGAVWEDVRYFVTMRCDKDNRHERLCVTVSLRRMLSWEKMCYLNIANNQVIASTITKKRCNES